MKPLRDKHAWPQIAVFDIEATEWTNILCICHMDEFNNRKWFKSRGEYVDWLFTRFPGEHVWSHWGGHYDMRFIIAEAYYRGWGWKVHLSGPLIVILTIRDHKGKEINFCESARLMPDSLEKIGKSVGIEKIDLDRTKMHTYDMEMVVSYCFNDCKILMRGLQDMRKTLVSAGCDFAYTLASICTRYIRRSGVLEWHRFYETKNGCVTYSSKVLEADEFCMPAYFGGRVEVFKAGKFKNLYYYDITSSYPWSMTHELPAYFRRFQPPNKNLEQALNVCGISDATIFIPRGTLYAPVLPVRYQGKLGFPEGWFRGRWANVELKAFWQRTRKNPNVKITIHGQAVYEPLAFLKPFVETFYQLRQKAMTDEDEFRKYAFKICLNSVYGKLVESIQKRSILHGDMAREAMDTYGVEAMKMTPVPGVWALDSESDGPFRHVAAGCYVTARSRLRLLEGIEHCIKMGAQVYYCDTDSIITDKPVFGLRENKELGMFSIETQIAEAEIFCPKVYKLITPEGKVIHKAKGMPIKGLSTEESEQRWLAYTQKFRDSDDEFPKPVKEGIYGFLTDISKGRIEPQAFGLGRIMQNPDSKRSHKDGDSEPIYLEMPIEGTA
jgi:DNA polymerase type B, organellar and viral